MQYTCITTTLLPVVRFVSNAVILSQVTSYAMLSIFSAKEKPTTTTSLSLLLLLGKTDPAAVLVPHDLKDADDNRDEVADNHDDNG